MQIKTGNGRSFDTDRDLTAVERHIVQKLFIWETLAASIEEFRLEKEKALQSGWNKSGAIKESEALKTIIAHLEDKVARRLAAR